MYDQRCFCGKKILPLAGCVARFFRVECATAMRPSYIIWGSGRDQHVVTRGGLHTQVLKKAWCSHTKRKLPSGFVLHRVSFWSQILTNLQADSKSEWRKMLAMTCSDEGLQTWSNAHFSFQRCCLTSYILSSTLAIHRFCNLISPHSTLQYSRFVSLTMIENTSGFFLTFYPAGIKDLWDRLNSICYPCV